MPEIVTVGAGVTLVSLAPVRCRHRHAPITTLVAAAAVIVIVVAGTATTLVAALR